MNGGMVSEENDIGLARAFHPGGHAQALISTIFFSYGRVNGPEEEKR